MNRKIPFASIMAHSSLHGNGQPDGLVRKRCGSGKIADRLEPFFACWPAKVLSLRDCGELHGGTDVKRREFLGVVSGAAAAWPLRARAQQPAKRIAVLMGTADDDDGKERLAAF